MNLSVLLRLCQGLGHGARHVVSRRGFFRTAAAGAALAAVPALMPRAALAETQPLMRGALESLRSARSQLRDATTDKGGHRVKALQYIDSAIREVEAGIAFDNRH